MIQTSGIVDISTTPLIEDNFQVETSTASTSAVVIQENATSSLIAQRNNPQTCSERSLKLSKVVKKETSASPPSKKEFLADLHRQVAELKQQNELLEERFMQIQQFIEGNQALFASFADCFARTKEILLPPPTKNESKPAVNATVEEWRQETQKNAYFESMKTRFKDFLEKNPDFAQLLAVKFEEAGGVRAPAFASTNSSPLERLILITDSSEKSRDITEGSATSVNDTEDTDNSTINKTMKSVLNSLSTQLKKVLPSKK